MTNIKQLLKKLTLFTKKKKIYKFNCNNVNAESNKDLLPDIIKEIISGGNNHTTLPLDKDQAYFRETLTWKNEKNLQFWCIQIRISRVLRDFIQKRRQFHIFQLCLQMVHRILPIIIQFNQCTKVYLLSSRIQKNSIVSRTKWFYAKLIGRRVHMV